MYKISDVLWEKLDNLMQYVFHAKQTKTNIAGETKLRVEYECFLSLPQWKKAERDKLGFQHYGRVFTFQTESGGWIIRAKFNINE